MNFDPTTSLCHGKYELRATTKSPTGLTFARKGSLNFLQKLWRWLFHPCTRMKRVWDAIFKSGLHIASGCRGNEKLAKLVMVQTNLLGFERGVIDRHNRKRFKLFVKMHLAGVRIHKKSDKYERILSEARATVLQICEETPAYTKLSPEEVLGYLRALFIAMEYLQLIRQGSPVYHANFIDGVEYEVAGVVEALIRSTRVGIEDDDNLIYIKDEVNAFYKNCRLDRVTEALSNLNDRINALKADKVCNLNALEAAFESLKQSKTPDLRNLPDFLQKQEYWDAICLISDAKPLTGNKVDEDMAKIADLAKVVSGKTKEGLELLLEAHHLGITPSLVYCPVLDSLLFRSAVKVNNGSSDFYYDKQSLRDSVERIRKTNEKNHRISLGYKPLPIVSPRQIPLLSKTNGGFANVSDVPVDVTDFVRRWAIFIGHEDAQSIKAEDYDKDVNCSN